jgi:hypothetical protein
METETFRPAPGRYFGPGRQPKWRRLCCPSAPDEELSGRRRVHPRENDEGLACG